VTEQLVPSASEGSAGAVTAAGVDADGQVLSAAYVQIVEANASPLDAGEALERRDQYGRIPVIVRVLRQPPIRPEIILLAIGLGASGLLLPLFLALRAVIIVAAVALLLVGLLSRILLRVPPGSVGLVMRRGRHERVLQPGVHRVSPNVVLTHLVTTREVAFDVPVSEVRSSDGIAVTVDLLLTLGISDPVRCAYSISSNDLDQLVHASTQEAVRTLIRGTEALDALDLGPAGAARLRETVDTKLGPYGLAVHAIAFTRVTLPSALMGSIEARRLAAVQLVEEEQEFALNQRRISDRASLLAQEAEARRASIEHEADGEAIRLARLEQRLAASPAAARYDLETSRLRVAQELAGNTRAVVSLGGRELLADLLVAREATSETVRESAAPPPAAPLASTAPASGEPDGADRTGGTTPRPRTARPRPRSEG